MKLSKIIAEKGFKFEDCRYFHHYGFDENWFEKIKEKFITLGKDKKEFIKEDHRDEGKTEYRWVEIPPIYYPLIMDEDDETMDLRIVFPDKKISEDILEELSIKGDERGFTLKDDLEDLKESLWYFKNFLTPKEHGQMANFLENMSERDFFRLSGIAHFDLNAINKVLIDLENILDSNTGGIDQKITESLEKLSKDSGFSWSQLISSCFHSETVATQEVRNDLEEFQSGIKSIQELIKMAKVLRKMKDNSEKLLQHGKDIRNLCLRIIKGTADKEVEPINYAQFMEIRNRTHCISSSRPRNRNLTDLEVCQLKIHCKDDPEKLKILNNYPHFLVNVENPLTSEEAEALALRSLIFVPENELPALPVRVKKVYTRPRTFQETLDSGDIEYATRPEIMMIVLCSRNYFYLEDLHTELPSCGEIPFQRAFYQTVTTMEKYLPLFKETITWIEFEGLWTNEHKDFFA